MQKTGAQIILDRLLAHGVTHVFEYPGGSICPILDEFSRNKRIRLVTTRHEQAAIHAADGYARVTRRAAVCMATSGPGASNLVTGIANAYMDSVPLVIITGQVAEWDLKKELPVRQRGFQELDIIAVVKSITKGAFLANNVSQLGPLLDKAFFLAQSGRPGPVLIDVPINLQYTLGKVMQKKTRPKEAKPICSQAQVRRILNKIASSKRPLIVAGGGIAIAGAEKELALFLRKCKVPVVQTLMGLASVPAGYPLRLGFVGYAGIRAANNALKEADFVLGLGTRFDNRAFVLANKEFADDVFIAQVDCDKAELNHRVKVDLAVHAEVKLFLQQGNRALGSLQLFSPAPWHKRIEELRAPSEENPKAVHNPRITAKEVLESIAESLKGKPHYITTDVGQHQLWTAQYFNFTRPNSLLTSGGLGTMGFGLPAAIGAHYAQKNACVVVISSDGSIQMNIQELATIKEYALPIKIIVFNNKCLGLVRQIQQYAFDSRYACTRVNAHIDFLNISRAYGIRAVCINSRSGLLRKMRALLCSKESVLVEVMIGELDNVYPVRIKGKTIYSHGPS